MVQFFAGLGTRIADILCVRKNRALQKERTDNNGNHKNPDGCEDGTGTAWQTDVCDVHGSTEGEAGEGQQVNQSLRRFKTEVTR